MKLFHNKSKKGYTLVELLAVMLVLALLGTLILTSISRESSKMKKISNNKTYELIKTGAKSYLYDNQKLKEEIKNKGSGVLNYITLQNSGYLSDSLYNLENDENLINLCVIVHFNDNQYQFEVKNPCGEWSGEGDDQSYNIDGEVLVGLQTIDNNLYYFNQDGIMQKGWQQVNNYWYYFDDIYGTAKYGLQTINDKKYYFDENGRAQRNFVKVGSDYYYFDSDYSAHYGWLQQYDRWYYFDPDGKMATGVRTIDNVTYYFYTSNIYTSYELGMMAYGEFIDGYWYDSEGKQDSSEVYIWHNDGTGWWYGNENWYAINNSYWIDGEKYTFGLDGYYIN